jgi:hypothetical protein
VKQDGVFDVNSDGEITHSNESVAVKTTSCLREFDQFSMRSCADFYNSLHGKLLQITLFSLGDRLRIEAIFTSLQMRLWPYPSPTHTDQVVPNVSDLVFEAFRNFVDVVARLSYQRGNALLMACQNPALTVPQVKAIYEELEETVVGWRFHNGEVYGYEDNVVVTALGPLQENLLYAIRLYESVADQRR